MSVRRAEQIIAYTEAMVKCYNTQLTPVERRQLHDWEASAAFTRTDEWPGWAQYIGLSPCSHQMAKPQIVRRSA
jgi:hypothetical protein